MSKSLNNNLSAAKSAKNDEFYTQLVDIENELKYYRDHFKGKTVYLNCDDPRESKFFHFFSYQFEFLGLKKLICTGYKENGNGVKCVFTGGNPEQKEIEFLAGTGGFETEECIELLHEADIVVSNPPFSKFREYVDLLTSHNKNFLIVGNKNAITCADIFPLIKNNLLWLGITSPKEFMTPEGYTAKNVENGMAKFGNIGWFTNLEHYRHNEELIIWKEYSEEEYPKYDNYNAINVDKVKNIPIYDGVMGVPITFLDRHNPEQFEILGCTQRGCHDSVPDIKKYDDYIEVRQDGTKTGSSGNKTNENPNMIGNDGRKNYFLNDKTGHVVQSLYTRLFIRRRK